jgi:hypothetical protein
VGLDYNASPAASDVKSNNPRFEMLKYKIFFTALISWLFLFSTASASQDLKIIGEQLKRISNEIVAKTDGFGSMPFSPVALAKMQTEYEHPQRKKVSEGLIELYDNKKLGTMVFYFSAQLDLLGIRKSLKAGAEAVERDLENLKSQLEVLKNSEIFANGSTPELTAEISRLENLIQSNLGLTKRFVHTRFTMEQTLSVLTDLIDQHQRMPFVNSSHAERFKQQLKQLDCKRFYIK